MGIDPTTTTGRLMLNMLAPLAEYERELITKILVSNEEWAIELGEFNVRRSNQKEPGWVAEEGNDEQPIIFCFVR